MTANLIYHVRAGHLTAAMAGRSFQVPTHPNPARVAIWEKTQELRSGTHTLWDRCGDLSQRRAGVPSPPVIYRVSLQAASPAGVRAALYEYPGEYAQRFDGVDQRSAQLHGRSGSAIYVGDRQAGLYLHGWPPCPSTGCVVVLREWDELLRAVANEAELSFRIAM